jgi:Mn-dependent DtxR family transcriptional regulator
VCIAVRTTSKNHEDPDETEDYRQNRTKHSFAPVFANAKGLHVSGPTIQNYLVDLERQKLVKLERIRKRTGAFAASQADNYAR